jgi:lysine 6-dehydrogenase
MSRILVLGGGRQGRVVAKELAADHEVSVVDLQRTDVPGTRAIVADLSDPTVVERLLSEHELGVGALPARLGFMATQAAIAARRNYVDMAFYPEDAYSLDAEAKRAKVSILPDCGLAPGLSNLVTGRAVAQKKPSAVHIQVGGVAADRTRPYGYVITWAVEDLMDEYRRPARIVSGGKITTKPALSGVENIAIEGVGTMEAFYTDGLRTLLNLDVSEMSEKTLRWPGHADAVRPLVASGRLVAELRSKCQEGDDLVVFRVQVDQDVVTMVDRPRGSLSAMSRTTAFSCAAFTRWLATGQVKQTGVIAPESLGRDADAYKAILDVIAKYDIVMSPQYPFLG